MATNFPASLDSLTNPTSSDSLNSPSHSAQHANSNDAIEALQAKVGADSSAVTTSLDYKVAQLEGQGAYTSYTPSFTNFTLGNGTAIGRYAQVNDLVFVEGLVILGSTSVMGTSPQISHPVGTSSSDVFISNTLRYDESGVANYVGTIWIYPNQIYLGTFYTGATWAGGGFMNATTPFTWGTGDVFTWQYFYRTI